jgi:hypothetical protein
MITTSPELTPGVLPGSTTGSTGATSPSAMPPADAMSAASKSECGCSDEASGMMTANIQLSATTDAAPSLQAVAAIGAGFTTWQNNKTITALWSINQNRNSWVTVAGLGWRKLADNSDSAIVALSMLGAHALEKKSVVNCREESDGKIHEMYVW